jgi:hypothetical protein
MEASHSFDTLVNFYQTTLRHIIEDSNIHEFLLVLQCNIFILYVICII